MRVTPDQAFELLQSNEHLIRSISQKNEADTRLRAIDTIAFDILKWQKADVDVEKYCRDVGFADYAFHANGTVSLVLEAKKEGAWFVLPDHKLKGNPVGFPLLAKECPDAEKALRQALGYAASLGAKYVAISNGHQWLLALSFVPNEPIEERNVFVFPSLDSLFEGGFREFFDCFSPEAIESNKPSNHLLESRKLPAPAKLSTTITNYPRLAERNVISSELYFATMAVWDEVKLEETSKDFLRQCYVETETTRSGIAEAEELIGKRLSIDLNLRVSGNASESVTEAVNIGSAERPIIILGKIGRGKSTFLRYLRSVKSTEKFSSYIQLDINLLDRPDTASEVSGYIYREIERQLFEEHSIDIHANNLVRGFLHIELQRFKNSFEASQHEVGSPGYKAAETAFLNRLKQNPHEYLAKVFNHLRRGQGTSIAVFLDNLDRRTDEIQEEAFLRASAMARDWSALVFVCLRPGTFYRSSHFGVLDSVEPRLIHIESPKTRTLVSKRMRFASLIAAGIASSSRTQKGAPFSAGVSVALPRVAEFLKVVEQSFLRQPDLCELFDAVSNNNARELLGYLIQVIRSGHLNTEKILQKINESENYLIPVHEALRALIFKDSWHYDPEVSAFVNLFDTERADPAEHFSRLLILDYLQKKTPIHPHYGYASIAEIEQYMFQNGYSSQHIDTSLRFLFEKGYLESKIPVEAWGPNVDLLRVAARGKYCVASLVKTFTYVDAVIVDTPIIDEAYRSKIYDVNPISARLERCEHFLGYLNECAASLCEQSARQIWQSVSNFVRLDIKKIRARLR